MRSATVETIEVPAPPLTRLARWCSAAGMAAVVALALGGLTLIAQGIYIHAKAMLAQILLERAFAQALSTGTPVKPWSWADTWPVARVVVPRLGKSAIVLAGSSGQALAFGPGQLERTPEIGEEGTAIYAAHRDTHFAFLADVRVGDHIEVTRRDGKVLRFRVTGASVVRFDHSGIDPYSPGRRLVLSTCWPLNARTQGPLRYVVHAEMIETPSRPVVPTQAGNQNHRGI
jgi:sortase A